MERVLGNSIAEVAPLCEAIELFCTQEHLPQDTCHDLLLILDELVTNIITHGFSSGIGKEIHIRLEREREDIHIEVMDDAPAFNPLGVDEPDVQAPLEKRPIGGLGIYLIKRFSEHMTYRRKEEHNILTIHLKESLL